MLMILLGALNLCQYFLVKICKKLVHIRNYKLHFKIFALFLLSSDLLKILPQKIKS